MDHKIQNKKYLWLLPVIILFLVSSCFLFSGTWVIIYNVDYAKIEAGQGFHKFNVDLTEKDVWEEHKDDIDDIVDVTLTFKLKNDTSLETTAKVYVDSVSTRVDSADVRTNSIPILEGLTIPANDSLVVNMAHYYDCLLNFDKLAELVKTGKFTAYAVVPYPLRMTLSDVTVVVTISAGL
ncbi:MAG: hypothetical protein KAW52_05530 [candidate division Zixibacteria bacterium]|nr:hypothetical protein [candidate division Zixibacteria bacterium]